MLHLGRPPPTPLSSLSNFNRPLCLFLFTARPIVRRLAGTVSQAIKDGIQPEEPNPEAAVALAMQKAADQMVQDYNDLVRIVNKA